MGFLEMSSITPVYVPDVLLAHTGLHIGLLKNRKQKKLSRNYLTFSIGSRQPFDSTVFSKTIKSSITLKE